jgi:uncharacterized membrane protein YjgN (DUF898 family)
MNSVETTIVGLLTCLLLVLIVWHYVRSRRWPSLVLSLVGLFFYVLLLRLLFGFPAAHLEIAKGPAHTNFLLLTLAMFTCMVLGMAAESLYHYLDTPADKRQFDLGTFVKPFLVSPLVFMPLAASLENSNLDLSQFDAPRLMVFLVAFENGFLWRGYFSRKLAESAGQN